MKKFAVLLLVGFTSHAWAEDYEFEKISCQITLEKSEQIGTTQASIGSFLNLYFDQIALYSVYLESNTNEYGTLGYFAECEANCVGEFPEYKHRIAIKPSPYEPNEISVTTVQKNKSFRDGFTDFFSVTQCVSQQF